MPLDQVIVASNYDTLFHLLCIVWTGTDQSLEMGRAVLFKGLHKSMIAALDNPFFKSEQMSELDQGKAVTLLGRKKIIEKLKMILKIMFKPLKNQLAPKHFPPQKIQIPARVRTHDLLTGRQTYYHLGHGEKNIHILNGVIMK